MIKISFILPMYRAENYLARVVQSLKEQTLTEFEAIFVNDGSPDNSAALCQTLFDGDARFRLLNKENGGVSSARNAGLDAASGKYIFFVDPDDRIEPCSAQVLWETAEREQADIVFFGRVNDHYKAGVCTGSEIAMPQAEGVFRDHPCQKLFDKIATSYFVTDKLFKRDCIETASLRFRPMNIGEDGVFVSEYMRQDPKCAVFLHQPLYHYTIDETATLSASYHPEREKDNFRLSETIKETVKTWRLMDSPMHKKTVKYCVVRDLQMGIKNINLSGKVFREKYGWLKQVMRDGWIRAAVKDTPLTMAGSRNDKIKLLCLKLHLYRTVLFVSGLHQTGGRK